MEFTRDALLGDESRMLASSVRDFRAAEIDDAARELDEDPESGLAESLFRTAESLGLADALLSEKAGGQGMDAMSFCLALEEVAAGSAGFASLLLSHDLALWALNLAGAAEGAEGPTEGERLALAFPSVEEAGALLSEFVSGLTGAAACVVVNPSSGEVYAVLTGSEFADVMDIPEPLGLRAARPAGIRIRAGEVVPAGCLSEEELRQLEALLLLGIGALAVGLTRRALEKAHSYARERYQGGDLIINHFIDVYAVNVTNEKCEISVIYDGQEDVVWEHDLSDGSWGDIFGTDMLIPLDEFLGETVQLKFRSYGAKSNALWGWFIFNLNLTTFFNHDLAALEMVGPGNIDPGQEGNWMLNVKNLGLQSATDFDIKLYSYKETGHIAEGSFSGEITTGETGQVPVSWTTDEVHNTVLYAVIEDDNDQFQRNNKSESHFLRIEPEQYYNVLLWDNDNGITTVVNPETGVLQHPNTGIEKALQNAGIEYTYTTNLPQSIGQYDIIISTLGCYCLS